jgi:hypothetical protein
MVTKRTPAKKAHKRRAKKIAEPSLWQRLAAIGDSVPAEEWEKLPRDLAKNFDHYAHGSPRQD